MKTWLLTWNPKLWNWEDLDWTAKRVQTGKTVTGGWSCGVTKSIRAGDRLFLIRLGKEPRGIVASGRAIDEPMKGRAWVGKPNRKAALYVDLAWDSLLTDQQVPLSIAKLKTGRLANMYWETRSSGVEIAPDIAAAIESTWNTHYEKSSGGSPTDLTIAFNRLVSKNENVASDEEFTAFEGTLRKLFVKHRIREHRLRQLKIGEALRTQSLKCEVSGCGFNFEKAYGALGMGFAEVHHLRPLARSGPCITTLDDLAIVCANCHRMIHRGGQCRPIDRLIPAGRQRG